MTTMKAAEAATKTAVPQTPADLRAHCARVFANLGMRKLPSLRAVEYLGVEEFRDLPIKDTILGALAEDPTAVAAGITQDSTVGHVADLLGLTQSQMDRTFCGCLNGGAMTGITAAENLRKFK